MNEQRREDVYLHNGILYTSKNKLTTVLYHNTIESQQYHIKEKQFNKLKKEKQKNGKYMIQFAEEYKG